MMGLFLLASFLIGTCVWFLSPAFPFSPPYVFYIVVVSMPIMQSALSYLSCRRAKRGVGVFVLLLWFLIFLFLPVVFPPYSSSLRLAGLFVMRSFCQLSFWLYVMIMGTGHLIGCFFAMYRRWIVGDYHPKGGQVLT